MDARFDVKIFVMNRQMAASDMHIPQFKTPTDGRQLS